MLEKSPNIPSLLTELINLDTEYLNTNAYEHDYQRNKVVLPQDKAFSERGAYFDARPTSSRSLHGVFSLTSLQKTYYVHVSRALKILLTTKSV